MRYVCVVLLVGLGACKSAPPLRHADGPAAPLDAFAAVEFWAMERDGVAGEAPAARADTYVERMHAAPQGYVALVVVGERYELVRVAKRDGIWQVVETLPAQADYLWPEQ